MYVGVKENGYARVEGSHPLEKKIKKSHLKKRKVQVKTHNFTVYLFLFP